MIHDLQKASVWKRISAALLDFVILFVVVEGLILLLTTLLGFPSYLDRMDALKEKYLSEYGIERILGAEELSKLPEEEQNAYKAKVEAANNASQRDEEFISTYGMIVSLSLMMTTLSVLFAFLILEFAVPLWLKNGQTIGKKVFSIGLIRVDSVQLTTLQLFVRTILGKFTLEIMIPVYIIIMVLFNATGLMGILVLFAVPITQLILLAVTKNNALIHDLMAGTVAVDISSQMIFKTTDDLIAYKNKIHAEQAARSNYY